MRTITNESLDKYDVAILLKYNALSEYALNNYYLNPLKQLGVVASFIGVSLEYFDKKKPTINQMREYLTTDVLPMCKELGIKILYCTDGNYMKALTGKNKVEPLIGYIVPCKLKDYEDINIIYSVNHQALFANNNLYDRLYLANKTLADWLSNSYKEIGTDIIKNATHVTSDYEEFIKELYKHDALTCDIETYSLKHTKAGLATIAFAWNKHEGICFSVDYDNSDLKATQIKLMLKEFFENYQGKLIFHNASFDIKILIYELFMNDSLDTENLILGLKHLTRNFEDTKIITYLATNNCSINKLSLKDQAHEYVGNYAIEEIKDISKVELPILMNYNLIDSLATWYVYDKHYQTMVDDNQEDTYKFFKNILINIIQMELTGLPIDIVQTRKVDKLIKGIIEDNKRILKESSIIQEFSEKYKQIICDAKNAKYKKKIITVDDINYSFNPNSNKEMISLLYDHLAYTVHSLTETGKPSIDGDSLKLHILNATNPDEIEVLEAISKILEGDKIRNTFIKQFLESDEAPDGWNYLYGSLNLGGTKSGRLSSSKPNLQNLPSGSTYGKLIKSCFRGHNGFARFKPEKFIASMYSTDTLMKLTQITKLADNNLIKPRVMNKFKTIYNTITEDVSSLFDIDNGWLFFGIDYSSLEDRVNTILTKDPNKEKIYLDGYCGHCFRSYYYFKDEMLDIQQEFENASTEQEKVKIINSIKYRYPKLRNKSKTPSFLLQYLGSWRGLVKSCGFSEDEAKKIEANYYELYKVSNAWVQSRIDKASIDGFVTLAFGLRLRTPILKSTILNTSITPQQAVAESRTAGNAISGQSYCLLNSRAGIELQERILASEYRYDILPCTHIHDAQYGLVRNNPKIVAWLNKTIVECVEWNELPELQHDSIKLTGNLGLFYPDWSNEIELEHNISPSEIWVEFNKQVEKYFNEKNIK